MSTFVISNISFHLNYEPVTFFFLRQLIFSLITDLGCLEFFQISGDLCFFPLQETGEERQVRLLQMVSLQKEGLETYEKLVPCITFQARHPKLHVRKT